MDAQTVRSAVIPLRPYLVEDEALVRAQSGDLDAFRSIVLTQQAQIFSIALRLTGRRADAEELAQDVFVQLYVSLTKIENTAHLQHWLLRTISHRCIDLLRQRDRQGKQIPLEALRGEEDLQSPDSASDPLAEAYLRRQLLQLNTDARAVVLLRFQEDFDPADIAAALAMPLNTVKSHLRRSIEWLRAKCAGENNGY